ncbi:MAG: hypothetical protein LBL85_02095 [Methanocalculaceae archaeon]|jgi:formate dehydrogenase major subunit|nr:hypothetical protein [Methanocalculaceae archaeon]
MEMEYVPTTCPYCGTGCGLNIIVVDGKAAGVAPYHRSPVGSGKLCTRGLHAAKTLSEWRIEKPSVKGEPVTWDEAIAEAKKLAAYSGDEIAVAISSRLTNEAMFLAACYARDVLGAANIGVVGGGCGASTITIADLAKADTVLMIGDVMKSLPVTGNKLYRVQANCFTSDLNPTLRSRPTQRLLQTSTPRFLMSSPRNLPCRKSGCDVSCR